MSPVEHRGSGHAGRAMIVAAVGVVVAMGAAFGLAVLSSQGTVEVRLGDDRADLGDAESIAGTIADTGPIPYPDLAGGDRDIVLQHLGDNPREGWVALAARPPGVPRRCGIVWQEDEEVFRLLDAGNEEVTGECDGRAYPADGGDLPRYEVTVRDGTLYLDIWAGERPEGEDSEPG